MDDQYKTEKNNDDIGKALPQQVKRRTRQPNLREQWEGKQNRSYIPFLGLGTLGAGVQRQIWTSPPAAPAPAPAELLPVEVCKLRFSMPWRLASSVLMLEALFLDKVDDIDDDDDMSLWL